MGQTPRSHSTPKCIRQAASPGFLPTAPCLQSVEPCGIAKIETQTLLCYHSKGEDDGFLKGILSYDVASGKFNYEHEQRFPVCPTCGNAILVVEGLIFCNHPDQKKFKGQQGVCNVHTRTWHAITPAPAPAPVNNNSGSKHRKYSKSAYGMIVDTSERPYSFKLVGSCEKKTQIYDSKSRSWKTLSSQLMPLAGLALDDCQYLTRICSNGCLYISLGVKILLMYSIEGDNWTALDFPQVGEDQYSCPVPDDISTHALGLWEGRNFSNREKPQERKVSVGASRPEVGGICRHVGGGVCLAHGEYFRCWHHDSAMLLQWIYSWQFDTFQVESLMMLNRATKEWKHVDLPMGTVAIKGRYEDSDYEPYEEEEEEDDDDEEV